MNKKFLNWIIFISLFVIIFDAFFHQKVTPRPQTRKIEVVSTPQITKTPVCNDLYFPKVDKIINYQVQKNTLTNEFKYNKFSIKRIPSHSNLLSFELITEKNTSHSFSFKCHESNIFGMIPLRYLMQDSKNTVANNTNNLDPNIFSQIFEDFNLLPNQNVYSDSTDTIDLKIPTNLPVLSNLPVPIKRNLTMIPPDKLKINLTTDIGNIPNELLPKNINFQENIVTLEFQKEIGITLMNITSPLNKNQELQLKMIE